MTGKRKAFEGCLEEMLGKKFGRLTVLAPSETRSNSDKFQYVCRCDCGAMRTVIGAHLRSGSTESCGCKQKETASTCSRKHGFGSTRKNVSIEYRTWLAIRNRCNNPKFKSYKYYGGKGVKVCSRWDDFSNFLQDMGRRPEGHSIDRINSDGDYAPDNCRWADIFTQANNKKDSRSIAITISGQTYRSIRQASKVTGVGRPQLRKLHESGC